MDAEQEDLPPGPMVLMLPSAQVFVVIVDPPLPCGNHRRTFSAKSEAWHYAQTLWTSHRLGFADHSTGNAARFGNGPYRERT